MEVLIVARTRMSEGKCCVGGLELNTNQSLRLMQASGCFMPENMPIEVGSIWTLDYSKASAHSPPHVEDVVIDHFNFLRNQARLSSFLLDRVQPWRGEPEQLFEGKLSATEAGKGFIGHQSQMPGCSTGFWISDQDLILTSDNNKKVYLYPKGTGICVIPYVGYARPQAKLQKGTLLRVSLARWWKPKNSNEEQRCYLQLSGWYTD
jgi:hypothetical protein